VYETLQQEDAPTAEPVVNWDKIFRGKKLDSCVDSHQFSATFSDFPRLIALFLLLCLSTIPAYCREKDVLEYGAGLIVNIPHPEPEVVKVVEEVAQNTIIRGTKEYNKDEFVSGATSVPSTAAFPAWTEGGKVFYKVRMQALDPRNFKDSGDVGTLAVRYVVQPQGDQNTVLRIDAIFVENYRHATHQSNGSVESNEYQDIQSRLEAAELMKKETAEALRQKQEFAAKKQFGLGVDGAIEGAIGKDKRRDASANANDTVLLSTPPATVPFSSSNPGAPASPAPPEFATPPPSNSSSYESPESLEQHVVELRRQVERLVKKPGAPLKAAPFHTANTLKSLEPGAEVLIVISTTYWFGVETHDGQHGWILREQLEQLP
jgi:hypothetical protein